MSDGTSSIDCCYHLSGRGLSVTVRNYLQQLEMVTLGVFEMPYAKSGRIVIVCLCLASVLIIANGQRTPQEEGDLLYCFYLLFPSSSLVLGPLCLALRNLL